MLVPGGGLDNGAWPTRRGSEHATGRFARSTGTDRNGPPPRYSQILWMGSWSGGGVLGVGLVGVFPFL